MATKESLSAQKLLLSEKIALLVAEQTSTNKQLQDTEQQLAAIHKSFG
tara:strand:- start:76 stop:219 length:144 start_codon:yes stop_codon:yes gene_type:complete